MSCSSRPRPAAPDTTRQRDGPSIPPDRQTPVVPSAHLSSPPAYQALAAELRRAILAGVWRPGQRLPTEPQLQASSGLGRATVRTALRQLGALQIITTRGRQGGNYVAIPEPTQSAAPSPRASDGSSPPARQPCRTRSKSGA
ncbi:winged helix-turn-helix domain-containing protein [Dactylosporangium sp. NPDC000521]|uniref:winged helix-turn-helix domain-containing protein n=1 Tax=Dactylosporangium sp. NPDC000521 TaxID=3363975 RepID=UPI0036CC0522